MFRILFYFAVFYLLSRYLIRPLLTILSGKGIQNNKRGASTLRKNKFGHIEDAEFEDLTSNEDE